VAWPGNLLVRSDASFEIGVGHVVRCSALAQAWQDIGGHACFVVSDPPAALHTQLSDENIEVVVLDANPASADDADFTANRALELDAVTVLDGYHFAAAYQRSLHRRVRSLLVIDDHGSIGSYQSDWILDQNLGAAPEIYADRLDQTRLLLGTSYALLRRQFSRRHTARAESPDTIRRVLVTFGGTDSAHMTGKAIAALDATGLETLEIIVVMGATNQAARAFDPPDDTSRHRVNVVSNVRDMASVMRTVDLAIGAAGSTSWELATMGVPAVLTAIAENQRPIADALRRAGAAVGVAAEGTGFTERLARAVEALAGDSERRHNMSRTGIALVDGRGSARVAAKISEAK
jgi:UDP-2,4-diacetamido-2,4,6-trideoxy-beta-L-altropyranose hydrolase